MSEYAAKKPDRGEPIENTLFDDDFVDIVAETAGSREEAMRQLGVKPTEVLIPEPAEVKPGAAVDLHMRAIAAETIMNHFNHQSKLNGASKVRGVGGNKFDQFYTDKKRNPDAWYEGMVEKDAVMADHAKEALDVLTTPNAMRAAGFSEDEITAARRGVQREMSDFEPGASNGFARKQKLKQFKNTDERAQRSKGKAA